MNLKALLIKDLMARKEKEEKEEKRKISKH